MIDLLREGLTPDNICSSLRLCDSPSIAKIEKLPLIYMSKMLQYGDLQCTLCKHTVTTIEEKLGLGHLEEWIIGNFTEVSIALSPFLLCQSYITRFPLQGISKTIV